MNNCLVIIRNKKLNIDYDKFSSFIREFYEACYYFDKISIIGFDSSRGISEQLKECKNLYENSIVLCNDEQYDMITDFLQKIYGEMFDGCFLTSGQRSVCIDKFDNAQEFAVACIKFLNEKYGIRYDKFYVRCISAPSELIYESIEKAFKDGGDTTFAVYDNFGDQTIEISYSSKTPKMTADGIQMTLVSELNDYVYSLDGSSLEDCLYQLLKLRRLKLSVAESFTGGGIAARLVSVPGVSEVFFEGITAYANDAKKMRLKVSETTLQQHGAVSEKVAYEMVEGVLNSFNCDVAVSTTGIAGPQSDNSSKPVGLAYMGIGTRGGGIKVYKFNYKGDRESIMRTAINDALFLVYKTVK